MHISQHTDRLAFQRAYADVAHPQLLEEFLADYPEIKLLSGADPNILCTDYAFSNDSWAKGLSTDELTQLLMNTDSTPFLEKQGYKIVEKPSPGNLIVYFQSADYLLPKHYGRMSTESKVISKFGKYHAFEHPIELVSPNYGTFARFFKK